MTWNGASAWTWTKATLGGGDAVVDLAGAGPHVLHMWMREDGALVDRILLTSDANLVPTGHGPTP
ncbi:MAG: hypothetical protein U0169_01650 [Polyangiaceae bacterium]